MATKSIRVVDHVDAWQEAFQREAMRLRDALGDVVVQVHHIGSTAVPGLAAKPVIDMLVEVSSLGDLDAKDPTMVALGYGPKGENGIPGRRYYQLGGVNRTHQVHCFARGDDSIRRHLAFRDYLRAHKSVADEYGRIKREAAVACGGDAEVYCRMKDEFIKTHERLALVERR